VDCQSRDRIARRQLSAKLTGGEKKRCTSTVFSPSVPSGHLPRQREAGRSRATATERQTEICRLYFGSVPLRFWGMLPLAACPVRFPEKGRAGANTVGSGGEVN